MHKILILSSSFHEISNIAAHNVRDALEVSNPVSVEVADLLEECYGKLHDLVQSFMAQAPGVQKTVTELIRNSPRLEHHLSSLTRAQKSLEQLIISYDPDVVCSTYPVYNFMLGELAARGRQPSFRLVSLVTSLREPHPMWLRGQSHHYITTTQDAASHLRISGVPVSSIHPIGFPTAWGDTEETEEEIGENPTARRILFIVNSGMKKAPQVLERLLEIEGVEITVAIGRNLALRDELLHAARDQMHRVRMESIRQDLSRLFRSHHLALARESSLIVSEAMALGCPLIALQHPSGEGAAQHLQTQHTGALAEKSREMAAWAEKALRKNGELLNIWRANCTRTAEPQAARHCAEFLLEQARHNTMPSPKWRRLTQPITPRSPSRKELLLCDLHTHTTFSDGVLTVRELVEFYGQREFDALCITDHICNHEKLLGKLCNLTGLVLSHRDAERYFDTIEKEKKRAWDKYEMILMTGLEFNHDGMTARSSTHLLGVDLTAPIDPTLDLKSIIHEIHRQGGLSIAAHPHKSRSLLSKDTLFLWENQEEYTPLIDVWEIGNRDDLFNPIGLKRLPFMANSDFHKPKHIHSWKTMLYCEKEREAIKQCLRINRDVAITLYRDHHFAGEEMEHTLASNAAIPMRHEANLATA